MKKNLLSMLLMVVFANISVMGTNYYVATNGSDSNSGTSTSSPFKTLEKAISVVSAGDYIYVRGGTHVVTSSPIVITKNGTSSANIHVYAYSGETPVLQFNDSESSSNRGIVMDGDYWYWRGIIIEKAGDNGMLLSGNNNTIENCIFRKNHDTGLQLSRYSSSATSISQWPSNNLILGCESYDNKDSGNENADGFAAKLTCGTGNIFRNCVSHHNIDDGWDLYTKSDTGPIGTVTFENCIAHDNGTLTDGVTSGGGDKNGFKLGSSSNTVDHVLIRCIAFNNGKHGFTDNGNIGNIKFYNLTSYNNGDYNYHTRDGASHTFRNCITLDGNHTDRIVGDAPVSCNGFDDTDTQWQIVVSSSDFQTLTPGPDSDPTSNGFLQLSSSSSLIDAGCSVSGVSYNGSAPDLGAIETGGSSCTPTAITPYVQIDGGSWSQSSIATVDVGQTVKFGPQPVSGGSWSWSGPGSFSASTREVTISNIQTTQAGNYVATYTNSGGCTSTQTFVVTVNSSTSDPATLSKHGSGSSTQTVEVNTAITSFYYSWTNATTVSVTGLPTGVNSTIDNSAQTVTISGTPTVTGTFNFTVTTVGGSPDASRSGTITVTGSSTSPITLTIQEDGTGFCSVDGSVDNNNSGYTGSGFANTDNASGNGITWSVSIPSTGNYDLVWRYANGGSTDRTAQIMVDGSTVVSSVSMPSTGSWTSWTSTSGTTVSLSAGTRLIRLQATNSSGLSNIDYMNITGTNPTGVSCTGQKATMFTNNADIEIYPNPVKGDVINISGVLDTSGEVNIVVYDKIGRVINTRNLGTIEKGSFDESLAIDRLQTGMYFIKVIMNSDVKTISFIKE